MKDWPRPSNLTAVRSFVGLCSYYRRFISDFATVVKPLVKLTEKNTKFDWKEEQEAAWMELKHKLTSTPVLAYPDRNSTFVLDTDASDCGIGAVLSQEIDGDERVISYGSQVLTKQERRYCVTRRELLAVVHFVKHFRHYLVGKHFVIRTDHASLRWLKSFKEPEGQVARWIETLDSYDYTLLHRPGVKHTNADALSRGPCGQCNGDHEGVKIRVGRRRATDNVNFTESHPDKKPEGVKPITTCGQAKKGGLVMLQPSNWLEGTNLSLNVVKTA